MCEIGPLSINRKKMKKKEGKKCAFVKVGGGAEDRTCGLRWVGVRSVSFSRGEIKR